MALTLPIDCILGDTCVIQQYMDHDPSRDARDYTCGGATYDGHKGTDFRVSVLHMRRGVDVLAARAGRVIGVRNDMDDVRADTDRRRDTVRGRECGNGVVIRHGSGFETQYCHLKRGSVTVAPGDQVSAGAVLGQVGLSGNTEFPHLHLSVRLNGDPIDPFAPDPGRAACAVPFRDLWTGTMADHTYAPTQLFGDGVGDGMISFRAVLDGAYDGFQPRRDRALVVWGLGLNGQPGDTLGLRLSGPRGLIVATTADRLEARKAQWYAFAGRKAPKAGWAPGVYTWRIDLRRGTRVIDSRSGRVTVD
ncbi:MAG: M23 family metallopeptidase [Pseudomonadota bacterium]